MSRTEGFNQPDLLNILRKQGGQAPVPRPPAESPAAPKRPVPAASLPQTLAAAPGRGPSRSGRMSRRDTILITALVVVVAGLVLAIVFRRKEDIPSATPAPPAPAATRQPAAKPPAAAPAAGQPSGPGALRVYTRAPAGGGRSFYTLVLVTYPAANEREARQTCDYLRGRNPDFSDLFLYRTKNSQSGTQQLQICLGHFDPNRIPINDPKASALEKKARLMPNAAGRREFETCYFHKLSVAEP